MKIVDFQQILISLGNDDLLCQAFLRTVEGQAPTALAELSQALRGGDRKSLVVCFHRYRGLMANLHASDLLTYLNSIENQLGQDPRRDGECLRKIESLHSAVCSSIREYLAQRPE